MDYTDLINDANAGRRKEVIQVITEFRSVFQEFDELPSDYLKLIKNIRNGCTLNKELLKFIHLFINDESKCLDPWTFPGSFSSLTSKGNWSGYSVNNEDLHDWQEITGGTKHNKDFTYDRIVGFMPFGRKPDDFHKIKTLKYHVNSFLSKVGKGIDINSKVFVTTTHQELKRFIENHLEASGLAIKAVLSLPQYTWGNTNIESCLLWLELGEQEDYFVGELSNDFGRAEAIFNSILKGGNKNLLLGSKVSRDRLGTTCYDLKKEQDLQRFSKKNGWKIYKLASISLNAINPNLAFFHNPQGSVKRTDRPEKITIGENNVHEFLRDNKLNFTKYSIDESILNLEFLKYYLERGNPTVLGKTKLDFALALPELYEQELIIDSCSKLDSQKSYIRESESELFSPNNRLNTIVARVSNLTSHQSLQFWISTLPFPISSILRIYLSEDRPDKKVEALLYFFEALTQFLSIVTISFLSSNRITLSEFKPAWIEKDVNRLEWYKRSSFGDWIALGRRLRKVVSKEFQLDGIGSNQYMELLGQPSISFIELISNKELFILLNDANEKRNQWKGHGGISSNEEDEKRSKYLRRILEKIRSLSQGGLQQIEILKSTGSNYNKGVYTSTVERLKGNETPFEKVKVVSDIPLDEAELYVRIGNRNSPYQLIPFIRYMPENKAVYYYSRFNTKSGTQWVTYNFPEESSVDFEKDESFNDALLKFMHD